MTENEQDYAVYVLVANHEEKARHDLRFLGVVTTRADDTMGGEMRFEHEVDALLEKLTQPVPRDGSPDAGPQGPWDMLPALLGGAAGVDAYQAIVAWPVGSQRQVNRPDRRPFRLGWHGGKAMQVRSL